jgi:hypothetical protein
MACCRRRMGSSRLVPPSSMHEPSEAQTNTHTIDISPRGATQHTINFISSLHAHMT